MHIVLCYVHKRKAERQTAVPKSAEQLAGELRLYRNRTALLQGLLLAVSRGFHWHTSGRIPGEKAIGFAAKLHRQYAALASPQARQMARVRSGKDVPAARLILHPADDGASFDWWLIATSPLDGEQLQDARDKRQRLVVADRYELVQMPRVGAPPTWTWRLTEDERAALAAAVERDAKRRDPAAIQELVQRLAALPMFSGVRRNVLGLYRVAAGTWKRTHRSPAEWVRRLVRRAQGRPGALVLPRELPVMRRIASYDKPPLTLAQAVRRHPKAAPAPRPRGTD